MKIYAHRGNIFGPNPSKENSPEYIEECMREDFLVEVDIWRIGNNWYLGHDEPTYLLYDDWVLENKDFILYHAKNQAALFSLSQIEGAHYFWHDKDDYALTNQGFILGNHGMSTCEKSIVHTNNDPPKICAAILTDYAQKMRDKTCIF